VQQQAPAAQPKADAAPVSQSTVDSRQSTVESAPQPGADSGSQQQEAPSQEQRQQQAVPADSRQPTADTVKPAAPSVTQTPAAARPVTQTVPNPGVRLSHAAEAVENTLRIAHQRGVTHARLSLRPAELGGVEVRLTSTANGLIARVTADAPQAAQVLQQAGAELRRSLEAQGIDLARLDIGVAGDGREGAGAPGEERPERDGRGTGNNTNSIAEAGSSADLPVEETLELPDGVLVDVLA
jgi:flagellar hook-length control protein FliK